MAQYFVTVSESTSGLSLFIHIHLPGQSHMGLNARKPVFGGVNNKGADLPAHQHRLISAFVICFLESVISKLATG